jgi:hypothetical protein
MFPSRPNPLSQALSELLTIRSGGHPWQFDELKEQLGAVGLRDIELTAGDDSGTMVIAKRG